MSQAEKRKERGHLRPETQIMRMALPGQGLGGCSHQRTKEDNQGGTGARCLDTLGTSTSKAEGS